VGEEVVVICGGDERRRRGGGEEEAPKRKIKLSKNHTAAAGVLSLRLLLL
jgi:hypothetical protein